MTRPSRWEAARDPHAARMRADLAPKVQVKRPPPPRWSYTADRALKVVAWVMAAAIAWSYRADLLAWWPW